MEHFNFSTADTQLKIAQLETYFRNKYPDIETPAPNSIDQNSSELHKFAFLAEIVVFDLCKDIFAKKCTVRFGNEHENNEAKDIIIYFNHSDYGIAIDVTISLKELSIKTINSWSTINLGSRSTDYVRKSLKLLISSISSTESRNISLFPVPLYISLDLVIEYVDAVEANNQYKIEMMKNDIISRIIKYFDTIPSIAISTRLSESKAEFTKFLNNKMKALQ